VQPRAARQLTFHGAVVTLVGLLAGIRYAGALAGVALLALGARAPRDETR